MKIKIVPSASRTALHDFMATAAMTRVTMVFVKQHPGSKFANKEIRYEFRDADDLKYRVFISFNPKIPWTFNLEYGKTSGRMPDSIAEDFTEKFVAKMQKRRFPGWKKGDTIVLKTYHSFFALNNDEGRTGRAAFKAEKKRLASIPKPMTQAEMAKAFGLDMTPIKLTAVGPQSNETSHFRVRQGDNTKIRTLTLYHPGFPISDKKWRANSEKGIRHKYDTSKWRIEYNGGSLKKGWDKRVEQFFISEFAKEPGYIDPKDPYANWINVFPEDAPGIYRTELFNRFKTQQAANEGKSWKP